MTEAYLRHLEYLGTLDREGWEELMRIRYGGARVSIPFAVDRSFDSPRDDWERHIKGLIDGYRERQEQTWQTEVFKQRKRLADAERVLGGKSTKKAAEDQRIATAKVEQLMVWLLNLRRTEPAPTDNIIYPMWFAPVLVMRGGKRVITPMRYHCRQAGKPANYDRTYPGLYNARRDNLQKFWNRQFGHNHAVLVATGFFENVAKHAAEHRDLAAGEQPENMVLEFKPTPPQTMYIACVWDRWEKDGEALHSFAAITDDPPAEVAAAGHDRRIIPFEEKNIDAWLAPEGRSTDELFAILDERDRPHYEHRLAA